MPTRMNLYLSKETQEILDALVERWGIDRGPAIARALALASRQQSRKSTR